MELSRRAFLGAAAAFAGGCTTMKGGPRHRSDYDGVQIGVITYSYRSMPMSPNCTLGHVLGSGLGTIELMNGDLERDAGAPFSDKVPWKLSKEENAAVTQWRKTADLGRFAEIRRRYQDAGVDVHIVKFGGIGGLEDWETDYCFKVAQAMGARAITREIPDPKNFAAFEASAKKLATFTKKYGIKVAFHNHLQINAKTYDGPLLDWDPNFMINFDIGHYTAANEDSGLDFVKKYRDHIFSIHVKDRTSKARGQQNLAFGQGDTPLTGLFALLKKERLDVPCDIELEYKIPEGSNAVKEVGICNAYCKARCV